MLARTAAAPPTAPASPGCVDAGVQAGPNKLSAEETTARREQQERDVFERTMASLSASPDPLAQATGLLLTPLMAELTRMQKNVAAVSCQGEACVPPAAAASSPVEPAPDVQSQAAIDALARLAVSSARPGVYALAFHGCRRPGGGRGAACQLITVEQWARLDADNAIPWAFMAETARERRDDATRLEAMHRFAKAKRSQVGWGNMIGQVIEHAPKGDRTLEATLALATLTIGVQSVWVMPSYQYVAEFCSEMAVRDSNRRQTCSDIADVMVDRSDTMIDMSIGARIGQRVGWPPARLEAIKAERDSMSRAMMLQAQGAAEPGCAYVRQTLDYMRQVGKDGEVGALRKMMKPPGPALGAREQDASASVPVK